MNIILKFIIILAGIAFIIGGLFVKLTPDMVCGSFNPPDARLFYKGQPITDEECVNIALEQFAQIRILFVCTGIAWIAINLTVPYVYKKYKKSKEAKKK